MTFKTAIRTCLTEKYFSIEGRASRAEYWYFSLFAGAFYLVFLGLSEGLGALITGLWSEFIALAVLAALAVLVLFIPLLTVMVRRLHDINVSFKLYLVFLIVLGFLLAMLSASEGTLNVVGWLVILAIALIRGSEGSNKFGPEPTWHAPNTAPREPLNPKLRAAPLVLIALALVFDISTRHTADTFSTLQADGTREVTLQDAGKDKQIDTSDDATWVLHFPAALKATPSGARYWQMNHRAPETTLNNYAVFDLPLTEFPSISAQDEASGSKMPQVWLRAAHKPYAPAAGQKRSFRPFYAPKPFRVEHEAQTSFYCRKGVEIAPGVFQLREPDEAETQAMIAADADDGEHAARARKCKDELYYAIYDADEEPLGLGRCYGGTSKRPPSSCSFRFWLPQERIATYRVAHGQIPHLPEIHAYVSKLVTEATVAEKSRNIGGPAL